MGEGADAILGVVFEMKGKFEGKKCEGWLKNPEPKVKNHFINNQEIKSYGGFIVFHQTVGNHIQK